MYSLPSICSSCLNSYAQMYLRFYQNLEVMKNTTYKEKCLEFDAVTYIITFTKKGNVAYTYITKKNRVFLKKGVFYWASKSAISVEKWVFFSKIREKGVFFKLGYERGIRFGRTFFLCDIEGGSGCNPLRFPSAFSRCTNVPLLLTKSTMILETHLMPRLSVWF